MALPQGKIFTIEDIYALPEGQRAELIDGHFYDMAPPMRIHQKLVNRLSQTITNYGQYLFDEAIPVNIYEDLNIKISDYFNRLPMA